MIDLNSRCRFCVHAAACAAVILSPKRCPAADTVETFDLGVSDVELYAGFDGLGAPVPERGIGVETLIGAGLAERLSSYVAAALVADPTLSAGEAGIAAGIFGTPVDGARVDLDLLLELAADGPNLSTLHTVPTVELNLDFRRVGLYLRAGADIYGSIAEETADHESPPASAVLFYTPGLYVSLGDRHQLLLEYHGAVTITDAPNPTRGGVALGWNVTLNHRVELINEIGLTLPDGPDTPLSASLYLGLIASTGSLPAPSLVIPDERIIGEN